MNNDVYKVIKRSCYSLFLLLYFVISPTTYATSLTEAFSTLDTGLYKQAGCQAAIDGVVGFVDGLGAAQLNNLDTGDDFISGDLSLRIGGNWSLFLFAPNCSKNVYLLLKPKPILKYQI